MYPCCTPKNLNNGQNEKRRKTNRTISNESIHKDTSLQRNSVDMRDKEDVVTRNPKEDVVKLSKLT